MAHVQKRTRTNGSPVYVVKWRTPDGKHRSKGGFRTKKEADAYAVTVDYSAKRGAVFDPRSGEVPFREAAQLWLESRHDLKPRTRAGYTYALAPAAQHRGDARQLCIDAVFGGYPLNAITRPYISEWISRMVAAGKKPSTVKHAYFLVRMVLGQAVADGRLATNPADYVKLPSERGVGSGTPGVVDDPDMFLTAAQVSALVDATPWPYNVLVHVAAWAGLRAAELAGLQVGDVDIPNLQGTPSHAYGRVMNPNAVAKPGILRVERTVMFRAGEEHSYDTPKTRGSRRRVPLPPATVALLRGCLARHPYGPASGHYDPVAPLFPAFRLAAATPTGRAGATAGATAGERATAQAARLAELDAGEAAARLELDWGKPIRHSTFYKAIFRPAVMRANRLAGEDVEAAPAFGTPGVQLPPRLKFHALRHTYASLCVAAGIPPLEIARFMGHAKVTTTLSVYAHLFQDDHTDAMAALAGMATPPPANVVPLRGAG